jgi:hypothetical protein
MKAGTTPATIEVLRDDRDAVQVALDVLDDALHKREKVRSSIANAESANADAWRTLDPTDAAAVQKLALDEAKVPLLRRWVAVSPPVVNALQTLVSTTLGCEEHIRIAAEQQSVEEGALSMCVWKAQLTTNYFMLDLDGKIHAAKSSAEQVIQAIEVLLRGPVPRLLNPSEMSQVRQGTMRWDPETMKIAT